MPPLVFTGPVVGGWVRAAAEKVGVPLELDGSGERRIGAQRRSPRTVIRIIAVAGQRDRLAHAQAPCGCD